MTKRVLKAIESGHEGETPLNGASFGVFHPLPESTNVKV